MLGSGAGHAPTPPCGHRYLFDGDVWQCWECVPPPANMVRVDLKETVN
jgi:hypothetical protein